MTKYVVRACLLAFREKLYTIKLLMSTTNSHFSINTMKQKFNGTLKCKAFIHKWSFSFVWKHLCNGYHGCPWDCHSWYFCILDLKESDLIFKKSGLIFFPLFKLSVQICVAIVWNFAVFKKYIFPIYIQPTDEIHVSVGLKKGGEKRKVVYSA